MTAAAIPSTVLPRVGALVRMLGSPIDGEALGAARALGRTLQGVGADLHALADRIENPPAPVVILQDTPASPRARRPRKAGSSASGGIDIGSTRRHEIIDGLSRTSARGALSSWEEDFCSSVIRTLQGSRPRLSAWQYEIVERLLTKFGEHRTWA